MYCVVLGDVIRSKSQDRAKRNEVTQAINRILEHINVKYERNILAGFGIVRGDAFEGVLFSQSAAPKIIREMLMLFYEAQIRVRISAVAGELSVVSSERDQADGPAFHTALQRIEALKKIKSDHWFQVSMVTDSTAQPLVDGMLRLISALTKGWTEKQTQIVWAMVNCGNKQSLVSEKLEMAPSVVNKQLKAAQYAAFDSAWNGLEHYFVNLEEDSIAPQQKKPDYTTYYSIACRKEAQGKDAEAEMYCLKAIDLAKEQLGNNDPNLARLYNYLSYLYWIRLGRSDSEEERLEFVGKLKVSAQAAHFVQEGLSKPGPEYALSKAYLGEYYFAIEKYPEAEACYAEAVQMMAYCGIEYATIKYALEQTLNEIREINHT